MRSGRFDSARSDCYDDRMGEPVETECKVCGRAYKYTRSRGHSRALCNSCSANRYRIGFKEKVVAYLGGRCVRCGYDRCIAALHAHHRDPTTKRFGIATAHCTKWSKVQVELDKCDLLCANCHAEEHVGAKWLALNAHREPLPERHKTSWPKRDRLRDLLKRYPVVAIAAKLGVSDNAVRKRARRCGLETPRRGQWGHNGTTGAAKMR
jgi:hypothetical protein